MADMTTITFRTDSQVKQRAKELYESMGLDLSTALNMFLRQSVVDNGMPFRATRENPANILARAQADAHEGESFGSVDDLMKDLLDA
ncbi:type II toxin-antitoxin system RelB/DinJ family antitoxin [Bifidobacterium avesanii]|uniref:Type II toxin-antitoxin system RelB/DinJ family antitoxin n=1 Tax=Bifidobacterium avesanii TaxID=1798157 RepID=A0A7K3TFT6_9BIFI|nr:type II toxin-antitoxin system RelB/DinJ family antitoxin [Bifidobacterium avesanii]KAB8290582.1 XRE family transcriptional regulator [Bifidobacterium avesanii]NEG77951.1 type II toxin-antitoxin system RelB/DinJ family antitoxin [Bifidobacterium avesanii]